MAEGDSMNNGAVKWIVGILISISIAFSSYVLLRLDHVSEAKLSVSEYRQDKAELNNQFDRMENKIDKIWEYIRNGKRK